MRVTEPAVERALVTGAAGFLGAALVKALVASGVEVHGVVHPRTDDWRLAPVSPEVVVHRVDLADYGALAGAVARARPTHVFHAAARGGHPSTPEARLASWRDSVLATASLLEALRPRLPQRFVNIGTSLEYRPSDAPLREDDSYGPATPRGAAKLAATVAVRQWAAETGCAATIVRPFSVYGPDEPEGRIIPTVLRCARTGEALRLTAGTYRRDFVHVDDVVAACLLAARHPDAAGLAFNIGTGTESSTAEVVALVEAITGTELRIDPQPFPERPSDRAHWVADPSLAGRLLGWRASIDLTAGLRRTYAASLCGEPT